MDHFWTSIVTIVTAIIGVAIIAVLVSNNAQTGNVISAAAGGLAQDLNAATAPVTGGGGGLSTSTLGGFNGQGGAGYHQAY